MAYATIRSGSKGTDTKTWQEYLKGQGYDIGSSGADGIFGAKTKAATIQYQKDKGLTADGIVGKNTWASMNTGSNTNTTKNTNNTPKIEGVSDSTMEIAASNFESSDDLKGLETEKGKYKDEALDFYSNKNILDSNTYDKLGEEFVVPEEVTQADAWLKGQLEKIQSGKTSWSDQYNNAINDYLNREKFEYDVDNDQLFQQALASAMNSGKTAMQDTIGQASALTGGYGSTYATSAGNQAYNQFIEDAYNNLPEYYQMAMEAYQMEGQEMLNRVNILGTADDKEYGKMVDAYNMTSDHRNRLYDEAYTLFRDEKSDIFDIANLKLTENSVIGQNLKNAYDISASEYESKYTQEFNEWNTAVENAWKSASLEQGAYQFDVSQSNWEKEFYATYESDGNGGYNPKNTGAMYEGYINPDDVEVDEDGNIISIDGYNIAGTDGKGTKNSPVVSGFRTTKGDNFTVSIGDTEYKVENEGKVTSQATKDAIAKGTTYGNITIAQNGKAYIKVDDDYYRVGNLNGLFDIGISTKSGYNDLLMALKK